MSTQSLLRTARPSGEAIAAFFSPVIGLLVFSIINAFWETTRWDPNRDISPVLLRIGSWIPSYEKIGPMAGKETILIVVWLAAWAILHLILRKRDLRVAPWAIAFLIGITLATLLLWSPLLEVVFPE